MRPLDAATLARCTGATAERWAPYVDHLVVFLARYAINTPARLAPFLGNVAVETRYLRAVEEDLTYTTADRLREIFPSLFVAARGGKYQAEQYTRNPAALSRLKYSGYHGRGLMHLTWLDAYQAAGAALGHDYVGRPELVMEPAHACATACWFWTEYKGLNAYADRGDLVGIRKRVNGAAALGLADVQLYSTKALALLSGVSP